MGILKADRISPTIFLGLGGSGSKAVNLLAGKIRRHPNYSKFKDLIHAVAIDTNKNDLMVMKNVPDSNRFLVSAFDRRSYIARKRGQQIRKHIHRFHSRRGHPPRRADRSHRARIQTTARFFGA